ncbi:MAG: GNAT family N-acetyltransferase [Bacteroidales bacterium]|nr:GNAT family N-acetyltransferase [Bacteroidales bacterium]
MTTIKSLSKTNFDTIFLAFEEAFKDYEVQLNKEELGDMLNRRGFVPDLSFGAFDNDKIIAFTLTGIGLYNGINTAYDTGTGTIKEYRGQGLASEIFNYSLSFLKKANIRNFMLEVLQYNSKAISVYQNLGFKVSREFNYYVQIKEKINLNAAALDLSYHIRQIDLPPDKLIANFWDFTPSWQNSLNAIKRKPNDFKILGAFKEQELIGYCILESISGDIPQIAVDPQYRRKGIASHMLIELLQYNQHQSIKIINTQTDCKSMTDFLKSKEIPLTGKQFEMIIHL